jgi:hypothetical protein
MSFANIGSTVIKTHQAKPSMKENKSLNFLYNGLKFINDRIIKRLPNLSSVETFYNVWKK